jgi:hypothetical protein
VGSPEPLLTWTFWSGRPDLIPYGSCPVKRSGHAFWGVVSPLLLGVLAGPLAAASGLETAALGQVVGLTGLARGRDDRGRGRSPRVSGLVRAG